MSKTIPSEKPKRPLQHRAGIIKARKNGDSSKQKPSTAAPECVTSLTEQKEEADVLERNRLKKLSTKKKLGNGSGQDTLPAKKGKRKALSTQSAACEEEKSIKRVKSNTEKRDLQRNAAASRNGFKTGISRPIRSTKGPRGKARDDSFSKSKRDIKNGINVGEGGEGGPSRTTCFPTVDELQLYFSQRRGKAVVETRGAGELIFVVGSDVPSY